MNDLITIGNFPTNAVGIRSFKEDIKSKILSGETNAGDAKVLLKSMEIIVKDLQKDEEIKEAFSDFADRYTEKTFVHRGMQFTKTEKKVYDFKSCGDVTYDDLVVKLEKLQEQIKEREAFLKTIKATMFDSEGIEIKPPILTYQAIISLKPM